MTIGWKLTGESRATLLAAHRPRYDIVVADHVTLSVSGNVPPPVVADATIIGRTDDGTGVEAMVVTINGSSERPDGGTWHITWSLVDGRAARESNAVIAQLGWTALGPEEVDLIAAHW